MSHQIEQTALNEARAAGAVAERERIASIVNCPEAKGKEQAAFGLALAANVSLASAKVVLNGSDFDRGRAIGKSVRR